MERLKLIAASALTAAALVLFINFALGDRIRNWFPSAEITHEEQTSAILLELQAIRRLLDTPAARGARADAVSEGSRGGPPVLKVSVKNSPSLGNPRAPLTLVEFTDYKCPFCLRYHQQTFPRIKKAFIDTGKLRYFVRDLPLRIHPQALKAAQAAHCAGEQGKYWVMQDALFRNARDLSEEKLPVYAKEEGLDMGKFRECFASQRYLEQIRTSAADAVRLGISGTPTFILGLNSGDDSVEGWKIIGAQPFETFAAGIRMAEERFK